MDKAKEQLIRQFEAGHYLLSLRQEGGFKLSEVSKCVGISAPYLSEIEKGIKTPSDSVLESLAEFYGIDEDKLFEKYGKIPNHLIETLGEHYELRSILSKLNKEKKISKEQKEEMHKTITDLYCKFLESLEDD